MRYNYEVLNEAHLYDDEREALLRCIGWVASWLGGVFVVFDSEEKVSACAFFIFSISLLMEFTRKVGIIQHTILRVIRILLVILPVVMFSLSLSVLLGRALFSKISTLNFYISIFIVICIIVDAFSMWFIRSVPEPEQQDETTDFNNLEEVKAFRDNLNGRAIDVADEGDDNNG